MSIYRFYRITPAGRIGQPPVEFECATDTDAVAKSCELLSSGWADHAIEIWCGSRFVGQNTAAALPPAPPPGNPTSRDLQAV